MHVLAVTGFFGSGKTSFVLRAARFFTTECGQRIAVVQNEINGEGVDDKLLRSDGLVVSELVGGCICCKLAGELVSTLRRIDQELAPDLLMIEASGMATPSMLRHLLDASGLAFDSIRQVALLDASRYARIERLLDVPLLRQAVETADLCLLNKVDIGVPDAVERFRREAGEAHPDCLLFETSLSNDDHLPEEVRSVMRTQPTSLTTTSGSARDGESHDHGHAPAICSAQRLPTTGEWSASSIRQAFAAYLTSLAHAGCTQVGHIKVFAELDSGDGFLLSVTDLEQMPVPPEAAVLERPPAKLTLNAIAYGVGAEQLETLSRSFLALLSGEDQAPGAHSEDEP